MSYFPTRRHFIVIAGRIILQEPSDTRPVIDWCRGDLNIVGHAWETILRGHIMNDNVIFYTGGDMYTPAADLSVEEAAGYQTQLIKLNAIYDDSGFLYNGLRPQYGKNVEWPCVFVADTTDSKWDLLPL